MVKQLSDVYPDIILRITVGRRAQLHDSKHYLSSREGQFEDRGYSTQVIYSSSEVDYDFRDNNTQWTGEDRGRSRERQG